MHRIDTDGPPLPPSPTPGYFEPGDPGVPRLPTQVDHHILNAFQEEIVTPILEAGITLVKGTNTQLRDALRTLFVRAAGSAAQVVTGVKTFTSKLVVSDIAGGNGGGGIRALFEAVIGDTDVGTSAAVAVRNYGGGIGLVGSGGVGLKGSATTASATNAGVHGEGASSAGAYGVIAEGKSTSPQRSAFRIVPQQAAPSSAQMGDLYVNASDGKLRVYDGTSWVVVGTQT